MKLYWCLNIFKRPVSLFMSADLMASLCGVGVRDFSSETTRPRDMLFFLKIAYLPSLKNCPRHADLFVRLFARAITPHPQYENFSTLSQFSQ